MTNPKLARDYLLRSCKRLKAVALLLQEDAFADVARESQEVVELLLKAVLRSFGIAVPFSHDLSETFAEHGSRLPDAVRSLLPRWPEISKHLWKDRELAVELLHAPRRRAGEGHGGGSSCGRRAVDPVSAERGLLRRAAAVARNQL